MMVETFEQGSPEWVQARLGVLTASQMGSLITAVTARKSKSSDTLLNRLVAEIAFNTPCSNASSDWMERGKEMEPLARSAYEDITKREVEQVGLVWMNSKKEVACSPDGFTCDRSIGLEIKCPSPQVMVDYIKQNKLPDVYRAQVQGSMMVTNINQWHFFAYHPGCQPLLVVVDRDDDYIGELRSCVISFLLEKEKLLKKVVEFETDFHCF